MRDYHLAKLHMQEQHDYATKQRLCSSKSRASRRRKIRVFNIVLWI